MLNPNFAQENTCLDTNLRFEKEQFVFLSFDVAEIFVEVAAETNI